MMLCSVSDCHRRVSAKGLCNYHYVQKWNWDHGVHKKRNYNKKCKAKWCRRKATPQGEYCKFHKIRLRRGKDLYAPFRSFDTTNLIKSKLGKNNPRWNGGNSQYPNHALFKKNRIIRIKQEHHKCQQCGKPYKYVHHIDQNKSNHDLSNLMVLCSKCHSKIHHPAISDEERRKRKKEAYIRKCLLINPNHKFSNGRSKDPNYKKNYYQIHKNKAKKAA